GEKLSIVTPRAQTTREAVTGILTEAGAQAIFVDTPGLLEPRYALQRAMLHSALSAVADADVVLLLLDATRPEEVPGGEALAAVRRRHEDLLVAINKVDSAAAENMEALEVWSARELGKRALKVSAVTGEGVHELRRGLVAKLPSNPFFYPEDELAVQSVRFFVAELVRETIFEEYEQEVPYSTVVRIEEYREAEDPVYIRATIYVERESQKAIVIGRGGSGIRRLGERARAKVEEFVGARVYLDLWVKSLPGWRKKASALRYLGYAVPADLRDDSEDPRDSGISRA
ncbi:MAG: GTPase Era, partial [Longimicrobiales bacterium]